MKLLIVRHAPAMERGTPGLADDLRPLTEEGIEKFQPAARALRDLVKLEVILTSPVLRAKQTAEILAKAKEPLRVHEGMALADGDREAVEHALDRLPQKSSVAIVGHEPWLSEWTAAWVGAPRSDSFEFKKGAAVLLEFEASPRAGTGAVRFAMPPKILRQLGEG